MSADMSPIPSSMFAGFVVPVFGNGSKSLQDLNLRRLLALGCVREHAPLNSGCIWLVPGVDDEYAAGSSLSTALQCCRNGLSQEVHRPERSALQRFRASLRQSTPR